MKVEPKPSILASKDLAIVNLDTEKKIVPAVGEDSRISELRINQTANVRCFYPICICSNHVTN